MVTPYQVGWLAGVALLAAVAARVYLDPVHTSRRTRVLWALFSGVMPLIGYFAFLAYCYGRGMRQLQATVR